MNIKERLEKYLAIERIKKLYEQTKESFIEKDLIAHNWDHIYRDILNAVLIGENERANMDIVLPATILHDVGFLYNPDSSVHHKIGAEKCSDWLDGWSNNEKKLIAQCILVHKGKRLEFNLEAKTLEEQVVCDADMLEKMGWIGVIQSIRTYVEFAQSGKPEYKSLYNISKTIAEKNNLTLHTITARQLAEERGGAIQSEICKKALKQLEYYL